MKLEMETKQTQQPKMNVSLQQALQLLQLSAVELKEYIEKEALENPWIDLKEPSFSSSRPDTDMTDTPLFEKNQHPDLYEDLQMQTAFLDVSEEKKEIIRYFILALNEKGYLVDPLEHLADACNTPISKAEDCLHHLQSLEPAGIGARTVEECLLIQARRFFPGDKALSLLISKYLQEAAEEQRDTLCSTLSLTSRDLDRRLERLRTLHPKPGLTTGTTGADYIIPDLYIRKQGETYTVVLNKQVIPQLELNEDYKKIMKQYKETSSFLKEKRRTFQWLKRSIEQRQWTLLAIANEIIQQQPTLAIKGICSLEPLTRKEIAESLEIHESTVSRAVRNKVVETPNGTYYMEEFFPSRTKNGTSSAVIKNRIHELVKHEDPAYPLSDQKLKKLLACESLYASRRTVAKYRATLEILSSEKR
ncbi:RNA polymerase factor sigma-54 [Salimicrobium flavidum]|uniref:RNA polymerase, sigma 54 subunit, RpoN/SigL n=1 Tax=Salimicrobium flavidum TaxID=570947 RepID=A0A1N7KR54_9BACI|nr:RNA polymerase factor sigma-54 [Salimicrobium flavidum]SIS64112.1 RNA polymerase, sigma 54 subunit, RpoN/SigL [Salimicrobium flavidum]